jgi:osmotically-inducible protein OsmY
MSRLTRIFLLPALVLGLGFSLPVIASSPKTVHIQPGVHVSDSQLESTIQTKLAKSKIGKDGFRFKVSHGIVTWEGSTHIGQHKGAATRMARTSGAVQVINNIQVAGGNKPGTPVKKAYVQ